MAVGACPCGIYHWLFLCRAVSTFEDDFSIFYINVLDPSVLKNAQANPEQYANLQVRLCGWNVHFVDLSKEEQDDFIRQSEHAAG